MHVSAIESNVCTDGKNPKQGLASAEDLTIENFEGRESSSYRKLNQLT